MKTQPLKPVVLLVDDEALVLESFQMLVELAGWEVETAASGRDALRRLADGRFDALITDMRMPEMDGVVLMRRARELQPDLPVVLMSAHEVQAPPGFDHFMPKMEASVERFRRAIQEAVKARAKPA